MRLLVFGDTHIKPHGRALQYEQLELPPDTDAIVTVGDIVHRTGPDDIAAGREFLAALADLGVPVYTVPGNHDPFEEHSAMVSELSNVTVLHDDVVSVGGCDLVGWGLEQFDAGPEVRCQSFASLDPRNATGDRRHAADQAAQRLDEVLIEYVMGEIDEADAAGQLDIDSSERAEFAKQLTELQRTFDDLDELLNQTTSSSILLTHVPPYGTELDRHHSIGEREVDIEGLHAGSIALKLAIRLYQPAVALSGHSHRREYEIIDGVDAPIHALNLGFQGIATVDCAPSQRTFSYARHNV